MSNLTLKIAAFIDSNIPYSLEPDIRTEIVNEVATRYDNLLGTPEERIFKALLLIEEKDFKEGGIGTVFDILLSQRVTERGEEENRRGIPGSEAENYYIETYEDYPDEITRPFIRCEISAEEFVTRTLKKAVEDFPDASDILLSFIPGYKPTYLNAEEVGKRDRLIEAYNAVRKIEEDIPGDKPETFGDDILIGLEDLYRADTIRAAEAIELNTDPDPDGEYFTEYLFEGKSAYDIATAAAEKEKGPEVKVEVKEKDDSYIVRVYVNRRYYPEYTRTETYKAVAEAYAAAVEADLKAVIK